jgi:site-specific DNA recombinase
MSDDADTTTTPQVGVYMRVSTMLQKRRGAIETQRPDLDRYLAAYAFAPYGWYEDEAVSGHWVPFGERPQGKRLLADAKAGHISLVLVWRLDRFGRNAVEILKAVQELEQAGARLVSLKESFDTRTAGGRLMLTVLAALSEYEWESIRERSEAGVARKLSDGGWMGGSVPYGYKVEGVRPNSRLIPDEDPLFTLASGAIMTAAEVVRLIYRLCEEGKTTAAIETTLNEMGVPTAYAKRRQRDSQGEQESTNTGDEPKPIWRAGVVNWILSNPVNKGEYEYTYGRNGSSGHGSGTHAKSVRAREREVITIAVPALVSVETWERCQKALKRNLTFSPRNAKHDFLLRGLITCGLCGHGYVGDSHGPDAKDEGSRRYVCIAARWPHSIFGTAMARERRCVAPPVRAGEIEGAIWADVEEALRHPGPVLASLAARLSGQADQSAEIRGKLAAKQQEQGDKQAEKDAVLALFRKGRIGERDLDRQLDDIAREEVELARQVQALMKRLASADEAEAKLAGAEALLQELLDKLDAEPMTSTLMRRIVERLVSSIVVGTEPDPDGKPGDLRAVVRVIYCYEPEGLSVGIATDKHLHLDPPSGV